MRLVQGAQEENHIFFMNGAKWLAVPGSANSGWRAAQHIGISEHFEFEIDIENPAPHQPVDHLYGTTATDNLWDGQWGVLRVIGQDQDTPALAPLPTSLGRDELINVAQDTCGPNVPRRAFRVEAWRLADLVPGGALRYHAGRGLADPNAVIFVKMTESLQAATPEGGSRPPLVWLLNPDESSATDRTDALAALRDGLKEPEPLMLRARAGECIAVELVNRLGDAPENLKDPASWSWNMMPPIADGLNFNDVRASRAVGLHAPLLASNARLHDGSATGANRSTLAYPCASGDAAETHEVCGSDSAEQPLDKYVFENRAGYVWYAGDWKKPADSPQAIHTPIEFGAVGLQNLADVIKGASHGTIGALVIEPEGSTWQTDCAALRGDPAATPEDLRVCLDAAATVTKADGSTFREFVLIYQNDASLRYRGEALANLRNGDDAEDSGQKALNYRMEPFWARLDANPAADPETMMDYDYTNVLSSKPEHGHGDPATPLFTARAGSEVRFRLVEPAGHPRNGGFTLSGHDWPIFPWTDRSRVQTTDPGPQNRSGAINGMGPGRHENVLIESAGGAGRLAGDYLYRTPVGFSFGGGQWGIMRVFDPAECPAATVRDTRTGRLQVCR